jgi:hypothetical protein
VILIHPTGAANSWGVTCEQHGECTGEELSMSRAIHRAELHTTAESCRHLLYLLAPHREHEWRIWWFYGNSGELLVGDRATRLLAERLAKSHEKTMKAGR